jgi:NADPH-dependent 2,4-dienoyl-CoA reductase/sulfur reductase-like enzyme
VELPLLAGCQHTSDENLGGYIPVKDDEMRTNVPGILVAGDGSGVAGSGPAVQEGRLAGITAARELGHISAAEAERRAAPVRKRLATLEKFRAALNSTYSVGRGIYELWTPETIVCRCEEVTAGEIIDNILAGSADPNTVKNLTRAGMGQCQGRNCARTVASLVARQAGRTVSEVPMFTPRPPAKPVPIMLVAEEMPEEEPVAEVG